MTLREIVILVLATGFSGIFIWLIQTIRERRRAKRKNIVNSEYSEKIVTNNILSDLAPGRSVELMRNLLGSPTIQNTVDYPVFSEDEVATNSYLYLLGNAHIKITSKDSISIDSITIFPFDSTFQLDDMIFPCSLTGYRINEMRVCQQLINQASHHTLIQTRIDSSFAIEYYIPNPLYKSYTYFGYGTENLFDYHESKNPNLFLNGIINGLCISNSQDEVYFIYSMELR